MKRGKIPEQLRWIAAVKVAMILASTAGWGNPWVACLFPDCHCSGRCAVVDLHEKAKATAS